MNIGYEELRYGNGHRIHVILNREPLEEMDGFKYLRSQVAGDVKGMWYTECMRGIERGKR